MHLRARLAREADQPLGAADRRRFRRARRDARTGSPGTRRGLRSIRRASSSLWKAARRRSPSGSPARLRRRRPAAAGRGAHEHLDPRRARQAFELGNVGDIVVRAADPEGEVAMHAPFARANLVGERGFGRRRGSVLGISNTAVTPPSAAAREPVSRSSLWSGRARGNAPGCRSRPAGRAVRGSRSARRPRPREVADLGDPAVADADVARADAVVVDDVAAGEDADRTCGAWRSLLVLARRREAT